MCLLQAREIPGIKIFRFECSLVYSNVEHFVKKLYKKTANPRSLKRSRAKARAAAAKQAKEANNVTMVTVGMEMQNQDTHKVISME